MQKNDLKESERIWNSLESSGRFSRFLEVSGRMFLEGSKRNGFLYIGVDGTLAAFDRPSSVVNWFP